VRPLSLRIKSKGRAKVSKRGGRKSADWSDEYRVLAPLHSLAYVPPALVALAARKCYAHRVVLAADGGAPVGGDDEGERVRVEQVLTQVLEAVETPL
jgi:hypothetical protein